MLELPSVTLCCVDTVNHPLALRALNLSRTGIRFARALFLTDALPPGVQAPEGIDVLPIAPLRSRDEYSHFVLKGLLEHIATDHVLLVQWDGYVVNSAAWDPAFLSCDYLGAKWFWHDDGMRVGNGGFSLRSRKLLMALQDPRIQLVENEDTTICRTFRPLLEREHGIVFGSEELADRFSFEVVAFPIGKPFGFHGLFNFCRTVTSSDIAQLAPGLSDAIARSPQLLQLARNCLALGQWDAAIAVAHRILAVTPDATEVNALLAQAEIAATQVPVVGRNEPCPCGSGRRYKQCHGALDAPARGAVTRMVQVATSAARQPESGHDTAPPIASVIPMADVDGIVAAGMRAHQRGDLPEAERAYRQALALSPTHAVATHYLGMALYQAGRFGEALPLIEASLRDLPDQADTWNNLGLVLAGLDRNDEAIVAFERSVACDSSYAIGWNNLGLTLQAENRLADACAAFRHALAVAPQFAEARWNLGLALLADGNFAAGWREYDARLAIAALERRPPPTDHPYWDGVVRPGTTMLVIAEQGLGDAIQFARFATQLADRGIRVLLQVPEALVGLLARVPGVSGTLAFDAPLPPYDAHVPLLSLPGILGVATADAIPAHVPYLTVDAERRSKAVEFVRMQPGKLRVGLSWAGSRHHRNDRRRSIPLLALAPWFRIADIAWFSLQKGDATAEIASVAFAGRLVPIPPDNDFEDTAALVDALDLVISVDTSIAHLAGALGKPVWILLPFAPDWRWLLGRADNPWYPTARLFRQPAIGDWASVIARVGAELHVLS